MSGPEVSHPSLAPGDLRRVAPSAARNRAPLLEVLRTRVTRPGLVLEIASGSGEHALWFSRALPHVVWQPTDLDAGARASIEAWRAEGGTNLLAPLALDAASDTWPVEAADVVLSCNMIHIAPWAAAEGLMAGAARVLRPGGMLMLYGPFLEGAETTPGNAAFDADLRARDPRWGVRGLDDVTRLGARHGLCLAERVAMPAGNATLVFRAGEAVGEQPEKG